MERLMPRYIWGQIAPRDKRVHRGSGYQFYRIVPLDVMLVETPLGLRELTHERVEEAIGDFWRCVDELVEENVDHIVLSGVPPSSQLGRARVRELLRQMEQRTGIPGDAPLEAVIAAMNRLGLRRIAVASRWAPELNARVTQYLEDGGLEVAGITARGQWIDDASGMSFKEGLQTAMDVGREAALLDPSAEAILVAGGAAMALHTVPALEEEFGKPVFTSLNAEVWNGLIRPGIIDPVRGWGTLLATPP